MHSRTSAVHDAFLSFTRKGHPELARRIHGAMRDAGLRVFIDEGIDEGAPISAELIDALAASTTLVVVYSEPYLDRAACQWELRQAFIAAAEEGDPARRILVVNPERGNGHIAPAELRDARYTAARGPDADLAGLIRSVRDRCASLPGPMASIRRTEQPRWLPRGIAGTPVFVGRNRDLWNLHTALRAVDHPLTYSTSSGPTAVIAGMPGIGKTSLARAYAWRFGSAYRGGVYWTSLTGVTGIDDAVARHTEEVRLLARSVGVPVAGADHERVAVLMGEYIDDRPGHALLIVDDVPPGLAPEILHRLTIPARTLRTVFTSRDTAYGAEAALVRLDGLVPADGKALLETVRVAENPAEQDAARGISERLGGHPIGVAVAAAALRNRQNLLSFAEYAEALESDGAHRDVLAVVGRSVAMLGPHERVVVELSRILDSQPMPADLVGSVLTAVDADADADAAGRALDRLDTLALARRDGSLWHVHPLIGEAAAQAGPASAHTPALTFPAARGLLGSAGSPEAIQLARTLVTSPVLAGTDDADQLLRLLAEHYETVGDVVEAARARRGLAASCRPGALAAAALACSACGDYAEAVGQARRALGLERSFVARWALAAALDGLARYPEADRLWRDLDGAAMPKSTPLARQVGFKVAQARAHLARGHLGRAAALLEEVRARHGADTDDVMAHQVNSATVVLAKVRLLSSDERRSRDLVRSVMTYYRDRNAGKHATFLEAEVLWAEAAVELPLFELRPDKNQWAEAEKALERLHDSQRRSAGPDGFPTLAVAVQRGLVLAHLGKRTRSRKVLGEALPVIHARLGERHPLWLRGHYALGLTYLQESDFATARSTLETTWSVQCEVLGPGHPETLRTQLELGIVVKFDDPARSRRLIADVRERTPEEMGRKNYLYTRAFLGSTLLRALPGSVAEGFWRLNNRLEYRKRDTD